MTLEQMMMMMEEPPRIQRPKTREKCHLCFADVNTSSISDHLFFVHGLSKDEIKRVRNEITVARKVLKLGTVEKQCEECGMKFVTKEGLKAHRAKFHGIAPPPKMLLPCFVANCTAQFRHTLYLAIHAQTAHADMLKGVPAVIDKKFSCEADAKVCILFP